MHPSSLSRHPSPGGLLGGLVAQAGFDKSASVYVTGPAGLAALLWLCRHGYDHVGLVGAGRCPANDCDLLLAPQTCDLASLSDLLDHGPHPRPGGALIVQTPIAQALPVHALLERRGYRIERCVHGHNRDLHVARRLNAMQGKDAA